MSFYYELRCFLWLKLLEPFFSRFKWQVWIYFLSCAQNIFPAELKLKEIPANESRLNSVVLNVVNIGRVGYTNEIFPGFDLHLFLRVTHIISDQEKKKRDSTRSRPKINCGGGNVVCVQRIVELPQVCLLVMLQLWIKNQTTIWFLTYSKVSPKNLISKKRTNFEKRTNLDSGKLRESELGTFLVGLFLNDFLSYECLYWRGSQCKMLRPVSNSKRVGEKIMTNTLVII